MSSTDTRTVDPAQPHYTQNSGHELSDFSWTTVLWLIPLSVVVLLIFFAVCIYWFKGAKDHEIARKQAEYVPTELQAFRAQEDEFLNSYKILDKDKGRYHIPIARAMELVAQEHQGKPGREWVPITDTYLEGAAFKAAPAAAQEDNGIQVENAPEEKPAAKTSRRKAMHPARNPAESQGATKPAPAGSTQAKPAAAQGKK